MSVLRFGHAPGHIRDEFILIVESGGIHDPANYADLMRLTGMLWNCTDTVPNYACDEVDRPHGSSFASVCRDLRRWLVRRDTTSNCTATQPSVLV